MRRYSSGSSSISSRRVPLLLMSIEGQMRLSTKRAVEHDFQVAGAFELLENHFVHLAAGIDQRRGEDRQRAPFFDLAGRAEELLRLLQGVGIDAAGEDLAGTGAFGVPRPGQPRDRIEENHHVVAVFDHPLGFFDDHFGDLNVPGGGFVERAGLMTSQLRPFHLPLHVGHFFRAARRSAA